MAALGWSSFTLRAATRASSATTVTLCRVPATLMPTVNLLVMPVSPRVSRESDANRDNRAALSHHRGSIRFPYSYGKLPTPRHAAAASINGRKDDHGLGALSQGPNRQSCAEP